MADDLWLTITRGARQDVWNLGTVTAEQVEDLARRARIVLAVPAGDDTPGLVSIAPGEPHRQTLARATVHELAELTALTPSQVDTYRLAQRSASRQARIDATATQVGALPAEEQSALRTQLGWNGGPRPSGAARE